MIFGKPLFFKTFSFFSFHVSSRSLRQIDRFWVRLKSRFLTHFWTIFERVQIRLNWQIGAFLEKGVKKGVPVLDRFLVVFWTPYLPETTLIRWLFMKCTFEKHEKTQSFGINALCVFLGFVKNVTPLFHRFQGLGVSGYIHFWIKNGSNQGRFP